MKYIVSDPKVMSGKYVIKGTRVPISRIIFLLKEGNTINDIAEEYPHISVKGVQNAVDELITLLDNSPDATKILQA